MVRCLIEDLYLTDMSCYAVFCYCGPRSLMKDVEAATNRLKSAKQKHAEEMQERQRYSNDLQERVVDTRAQKQEVFTAGT